MAIKDDTLIIFILRIYITNINYGIEIVQ